MKNKKFKKKRNKSQINEPKGEKILSSSDDEVWLNMDENDDFIEVKENKEAMTKRDLK